MVISGGCVDQWIEATDGVALRCRIWTPSDPAPWPVLLMRQPYGRAIASTVTYAHPQWYCSQGYAVVVQDVRGRGDSQGTFQGFMQEGRDGSATLAWLRNQSWCSGRIGCYGFSYQGLSQLLLDDPAQLPDALAPAMAGLDERLHWASEGGCHWWALGLAWGLQLAAQGCQLRGDHAGWQQIRRSLAGGSFLQDGPELLQRLDPDNMVWGWLQRDPASAEGWRQHEPPPELWSKPMLLIGGWHDPHLRGVLDLWQRSNAAGGNPLLRIGNWSHLNWSGGIDALQLAFFNHHLRGLDPGPLNTHQPCWLQDLGSGTWQARSPLQGSGQLWSLRSNGLAAVNSSEGQLLIQDEGAGESGEGRVTVVHDPWRALPGRGGHLGLDAGAVDRSDLDQRSDVACFSSEALPTAIELIGQPQLTLQAMADQNGFDLCVALSLLQPDGVVRQVSSGVGRWLGPGCRSEAERRVELQPLRLTLQPGERLRLSIGLAAWPHIAVNPGDGSLPAGPAGPEHRVISVQLNLKQAQLSIIPMIGAN